MDDVSARRELAKIVYRVNNPKYGDYGSHQETAKAIIAAGWRPPLPKGGDLLAHEPAIDDLVGSWSALTEYERGEVKNFVPDVHRACERLTQEREVPRG